MSLLKSIGRLKRMDHFIRKECSGTSEEFAQKLGICRSMLMENIREMKELGADVGYCPRRKSYVYKNDFSLIIGTGLKNGLRGGRGETAWNWQKNIFWPVQ